MPTSAHYLSFMGGSSLNLKESVQNLEKITKEGEDKFPPDIKQYALEVIESGNPENKTLIDIHKSKYSLLKDCYNLDDARALYDEFNDVLSDKQVDYKPDSFIDRVKKGEVENFNKDEDLAFQLLKLYWADGFSLTDLKKYCGTDLYHTLKKFNIPTMDKDYAHVLKFSDKEYNERLTKEMAQKIAEARERAIQQREGEPVFIPRGPLSDIHKKHISEGLIKYYAQHPEKSTQMSNRQIEYFKNNPEQAELMSKAMDYAWNETKEGASIYKYLMKYIKKNTPVKKVETKASDDTNTSDKQGQSAPSIKHTKKNTPAKKEETDELDVTNPTHEQRHLMAEFFKKNKWACELFSKALTQGWQHVKNTPKESKTYSSDFDFSELTKIKVKHNLIPSGYVDDVRNWCLRNNNMDMLNFDFDRLKTDNSFDKRECMQFAVLSTFYTNANDRNADVLTSTIGAALVSIRNEFYNNYLSGKIRTKQNFMLKLSG